MREETSVVVAHYKLKTKPNTSTIHTLFPMKFSEAKQAQLFKKFAAYSMILIA
jgi:hypothetical protein